MDYLDNFVYKKINVKDRFKPTLLIFTYTQPVDIDYFDLLKEILSGALLCCGSLHNGFIFMKIC